MRTTFSWITLVWLVMAAPVALISPAVLADEPPAAPLSGDAAGEAAPAPSAPPAGKPVVPLERLFELPRGFETKPVERRSGKDEATWRRRFADARSAISSSQSALAASKRELADLAEDSNAWTLAPPVGVPAQSHDAPLSYQLRQKIRRQEGEVASAKEQLLNLEVEANLKGVPDEWRSVEGAARN